MSWGNSTSPGHGGSGRPVQVTAMKSSAGRRCSTHRKRWSLAEGKWRLAGGERVSKKEICLCLPRRRRPKSSLSTRAKASYTVTTVKEVGSFPGRWEMRVWPPHRLTGPPGRLNTYNTPKLSPINHRMLRWTFTYCFQAKTLLTESHDSCDSKKHLRIEYYHFNN